MQLVRPERRATHTRTGALAVAACAAIIAALLSACGSSSKKSPTTSTGTTKAATANVRALQGVAPPSGAGKATPASVTKLGSVAKATGPKAHIKGLSGQPVPTQVAALDADLNQFWSKVFANSKLQWPQTQEAIVQNAPVQTGCSSPATIAPTDPPLICNHVFFWGVPWIQQHLKPQGGVELTFVASILWSLYAEDALGNTTSLQQGKVTKTQYGNQSLCFTGIYWRTLAARNLYESGDTQLAASFLGELTGVNQITAPDVTPQGLQKSFFAGYHSGSFASCTLQAMSTA
jgi:hypothetical protein